jgi:hypothetical protein
VKLAGVVEFFQPVVTHSFSSPFRWLRHPKMLRTAATEAEAADMVLVFRCANQGPTESSKRASAPG